MDAERKEEWKCSNYARTTQDIVIAEAAVETFYCEVLS